LRTIAWDVDDVLNELMREWFTRAWLPAHPQCGVAYEGITKNPPHELLGATRDEYLASLDEFRLAHARSLPPNPLVKAWFQEHGARDRHIAVTATPLHTSPISAAWVMEHFGAWIRSVTVIPSPRPFDTSPRYFASKVEYLRWLGKVDIFIDDTETNIEGADAAGIKTILFPRPWNASRSTIEQALEAALFDHRA
jgi:FMN phosphatase YigB (HAD superfamily)